MEFKAITFDFWYTLFAGGESEERHAVRRRALAEALGDEELANDAYSRALRHFYEIYREHGRTVSAGHLVAWVERTFGLELDDETREKLITAWEEAGLATPTTLIPGAEEALRAAAERCPIGLICDTGFTPGTVLRKIMRDAGVLELFSALSFSGEVGAAKPRPEIFRHACEQLGVEPSALLHIGDTEWTDIAGAHGVGAKAALFVGHNDRYLEHTKADYIFRSWPEFVSWLRAER